MLNRNKIFETVRNTTDTLNVSTNRKMDNFYTEMMKYENMVEKKYNRIKDVLATITYHHNKIKNLQKNYSNAIFGGGNKNLNDLLKKVEDVIDSLDKLQEVELNNLESLITIEKKKDILTRKEILNNIESTELEYTKITEDDIILLSTEKESLQSLERLSDKDIASIDAIFKKIEEIKDPITEYIRENKQLSRDLIDKFKNGIKAQKQTIEDKKSEIKKNFANYKTIVLSGEKYAKKAETDNKDETKDIDKKILAVFVKSPEKLEFKVEMSKNSGTLSLNSVIYPFVILRDHEDTVNKHTYFSIKMDNTDIKFYLFFNKLLENIKRTTSLTKNYCLDITSLSTILQDSRLNPLFKKFKDLLHQTKDDRIQAVIDTNPNDIKTEDLEKIKTIGERLYKAKILDSNYLLLLNTSYKYEDKIDNTKSLKNNLKNKFDYEVVSILEENIKTTESQKNASAYNILKQKDTFYPSVSGGSPSEDFKKTLNIIKKHISENIDKEYNKTEDKKQNNSTNNVKSGETTSNNQTQTKLSDSIISSIIQNYEKERNQINTIEEKIRLDTKFVDLLDNLGLNLSDIFKVTFDDKLAFIFFILVLHIIVYSIIESLIINEYIIDIVYIVGTYVGLYFLLMFIIILILNKFVSYKLKSLLNYINTDFNMQLISMHLFIVFMFYLVVLILSQHIDIFKAEDEDDKLQILYRIEVISSIIFIFSAVFVMIL